MESKTKLKKVYRVEAKNGVGPYNCKVRSNMIVAKRNIIKNIKSAMSCAHSDYNHPGFYLDFNKSYSFDMLFACQSKTKLKQWFGRFLTLLMKTDEFRIVEYNVPIDKIIVGSSKRQCVFDKNAVVNKKVITL